MVDSHKALPIRGPNRLGLVGVDHLENLGGQEIYVRRMLAHQRRMAAVQPVMTPETMKPFKGFSGGTRRTPKPVANPTHRRDEFNEVREAWRRIIGVKGSVDSHRRLSPDERLAKHLSSNRRAHVCSTQAHVDKAHAAELHHLRRRIANGESLVERKKNKLDPTLYPALLMRRSRSAEQSAHPDRLWQARQPTPPSISPCTTHAPLTPYRTPHPAPAGF